jgi:hypothetical protein
MALESPVLGGRRVVRGAGAVLVVADSHAARGPEGSTKGSDTDDRGSEYSFGRSFSHRRLKPALKYDHEHHDEQGHNEHYKKPFPSFAAHRCTRHVLLQDVGR